MEKSCAIQQKIGYNFSDEALLERAFTHNSYIHENSRNYQPLEFLGDSVVGFLVAEELLSRLPELDEGALTKIRANVVSSVPLGNAVSSLGLNEYLLVGKGEKKQKINQNSKACADLFEALAAAVYLDGGLDSARAFVLKMLENVIEEAVKTYRDGGDDPLNLLKEFCEKKGWVLEWIFTGETALDGNRTLFETAAVVDGNRLATGSGESKNKAKRMAAQGALDVLSRR